MRKQPIPRLPPNPSCMGLQLFLFPSYQRWFLFRLFTSNQIGNSTRFAGHQAGRMRSSSASWVECAALGHSDKEPLIRTTQNETWAPSRKHATLPYLKVKLKVPRKKVETGRCQSGFHSQATFAPFVERNLRQGQGSTKPLSTKDRKVAILN